MNLDELEERVRRLEEETASNHPVRLTTGGGGGGSSSRALKQGRLLTELACNSSATFETFEGHVYEVWEGFGAATAGDTVYGIGWFDENKYGVPRWLVILEACTPCMLPTETSCLGELCTYIWDATNNAWREPTPEEELIYPSCPQGCSCPSPDFLLPGSYDGQPTYLACGSIV